MSSQDIPADLPALEPVGRQPRKPEEKGSRVKTLRQRVRGMINTLAQGYARTSKETFRKTGLDPQLNIRETSTEGEVLQEMVIHLNDPNNKQKIAQALKEKGKSPKRSESIGSNLSRRSSLGSQVLELTQKNLDELNMNKLREVAKRTGELKDEFEKLEEELNRNLETQGDEPIDFTEDRKPKDTNIGEFGGTRPETRARANTISEDYLRQRYNPTASQRDFIMDPEDLYKNSVLIPSYLKY